MSDEAKVYTQDEIKGSAKGFLKIVLAHPEQAISILNDLMMQEECPVGANPFWRQTDCTQRRKEWQPTPK